MERDYIWLRPDHLKDWEVSTDDGFSIRMVNSTHIQATNVSDALDEQLRVEQRYQEELDRVRATGSLFDDV